jgi:hypothetical protein
MSDRGHLQRAIADQFSSDRGGNIAQ